jgi:alpha-beta hydrolase superfamily lysophospholipase/DNA-binding CsgD family transcriptional regulator
MQALEASSKYVVGGGNELLLYRSWRFGARAPAAFVGHSQPTHSGNVVDLAEALCRLGFNVHAGDLRGHGASVSARQPLGHLDRDDGWERLIGDMRQFTSIAFDGVPWEDRLIVGPNISGLLTLELLKTEPSLARNIVLISPPPNQKAIPMLARSFAKARALIRDPDLPDEHTLHHLYTFLGAQIENRQHLADVTSADRAVIDALLADPAGWPTPTLAYFMSIFRGFQQAWEWPRKARIREGTRILLMYGSDDPMMGKGGFVKPMSDWFAARGIEDVTSLRVEGARSAVFLDERKLKVSDAIARWFREEDMPDQSVEDEAANVADISSRMLLKLGNSDIDGELSADALVELCYNAIQDEERWAEMLHRMALAIARGEREGAEKLETLVSKLMPHWDRAYALNRQIITNAALGIILQEVIERFSIGVGLVTSDLGIVHYNSAFRDALERCVDGHGIADHKPAVEAALRALASPQFKAEVERGQGDTVLVVDGQPIGLHFRPRALRQSGLVRGGPAGVLVLRKPGSDASDSEDARCALLQLAYGLTQQEGNVALRIASGHSPEEICGDLGLSIHTVRTHLKRNYDKVGVQGQTELAARIMAGPVGWLSA